MKIHTERLIDNVKRCLLLMSFIFLIFGTSMIIADNVYAADVVASGTCGENVTWVFTKDDTLTISGTGAMSNYGDGVGTGALSPWSDYNFMIDKIVVGDGVTSIGSYAFYGVDAATQISLPNTLECINAYAFCGTDKLKTVVLPNGLKRLEDQAFLSAGIESISVPASVEFFGSCVFNHCSNLKEVELKNTLTEIPRGTFWGCSQFTDYVIPDGVTSIGSYAFGWSGIKSIQIPSSVETIEGQAFDDCNSLETVTIAEGVKTIKDGAFGGCDNLKELNLPESINSLNGDSIFISCPQLTITVVEGSYAERYVKAKGLNYKTVCKNHIWNEKYTIDKEATCTEEGYESIHCSVCGVKDEATVRAIDKKPHAYGDWTVTKEATCTEDGSKEKVCADCGDKVTEVIASPGHQWNKEYTVDKAATCTEEGSESIHCSVCGINDETTVRAIEKKPHAYSDWITTKEATCTEDGSKEKVCADCGDKVTETIKSPGHQWNKEYTVDKAATCTEEGSESIHCSVCGVKDESTIRAIDKKPHAYGDWTTVKEVTCTEDGSKEKVCADCGDKITETIKSPGHQWNEDYTVDKEATCTEEGSKSIHCSVCGITDEATITIIPASGHTWNTEYTIDKKATYAEAGLKSIHCAVCNAQNPDTMTSIPKLEVTVPTLSKPKAIKKGFTAKWKKVSVATGYEIQYALNSKFSKSKKTVKIKKAATVSKKITKLKAKKKYYVRVRAYKVENGDKYYSKWSKAKVVTTKK